MSPRRGGHDLHALALAERTELGLLLDGLGPDEWATTTPCERWTVRDVAAHVISYDDLSWPGVLALLARARGDLDRANAIALDRVAALAPADLVARYTERPAPRGLTAVHDGRIGFLDGLVHHQDVRRALGLPRTVPAERLRAALGLALTAPAIPARRLARGLRLVATDVGWSHGAGPEVAGPGEALLMAVAGRRGATEELEGPGAPLLQQRVSTWTS